MLRKICSIEFLQNYMLKGFTLYLRVQRPTYDAEQHRHLNKYTTPDLISLGTLSLKGKKEEILGNLSYNRKTIIQASHACHLNSTGHSANFDDFEILSSCCDTCELMIHESLLISKLKPSLNVQGSSVPLNLL